MGGKEGVDPGRQEKEAEGESSAEKRGPVDL